MKKIVLTFTIAFALVSGLHSASRADADPSGMIDATAETQVPFPVWLEQLWPEAKRRGVSRKTFDLAFEGVTPDRRVSKAQANQPEFVKPLWEYMDRAVSNRRIKNGKGKLRKFNSKLRRISRKFGVDRHVLVAIWGMESAYGRNKGSHNVIRALASIAYTGRRQAFGRKQLLAALEILERGDIEVDALKGSWSGAMGHTQFIPTTFNEYGVDFTGDGQRDIWRSISDALASTANYLSKSGWEHGQPWGYEVRLPEGFDYSQTGLGVKKLAAEWVGLGVKRVDGEQFTDWATEGSIIVPTGAEGPAFIVFKNFRAIMRYNNAISYALAVGHLSDRLKGRSWIQQAWPKSNRPLTNSQKMELQELLADKGYIVGDIDGRIGPKTQEALRDYQQKVGLIPDGYASEQLLRHLRGES